MVSIANQSGPVAKAGIDTGLLAAVSTPNTIADMNIGGIGASTTKDMVSPAGVDFDAGLRGRRDSLRYAVPPTDLEPDHGRRKRPGRSMLYLFQMAGGQTCIASTRTLLYRLHSNS